MLTTLNPLPKNIACAVVSFAFSNILTSLPLAISTKFCITPVVFSCATSNAAPAGILFTDLKMAFPISSTPRTSKPLLKVPFKRSLSVTASIPSAAPYIPADKSFTASFLSKIKFCSLIKVLIFSLSKSFKFLSSKALYASLILSSASFSSLLNSANLPVVPVPI